MVRSSRNRRNHIDVDDMSTADILIQVLDRSRDLQLLIEGRNLEMLRYLLNMAEHEAEAMLMVEHESTSGIEVLD